MPAEQRSQILNIEPEAWIDMNTTTQNAHGQTLEEMAETSPSAAYATIRLCLLSMANEADIAAGATPEGGPMYETFAKFLPETVPNSTKIDVRLPDTIDESGQEIVRDFNRQTTTILEFVVEPPTELFTSEA